MERQGGTGDRASVLAFQAPGDFEARRRCGDLVFPREDRVAKAGQQVGARGERLPALDDRGAQRADEVGQLLGALLAVRELVALLHVEHDLGDEGDQRSEQLHLA